MRRAISRRMAIAVTCWCTSVGGFSTSLEAQPGSYEALGDALAREERFRTAAAEYEKAYVTAPAAARPKLGLKLARALYHGREYEDGLAWLNRLGCAPELCAEVRYLQ